MEKYIIIALFSPLVASLFAGLFAHTPKKIFVGIINSLLIFASWVSSIILLIFIFSHGRVSLVGFDWISVGHLKLPFGFVADSVSVVMMIVVTTVSFLVHVYSIGYMSHDKSFNRFFSYLSAFVFSMMLLVMSDNFLGLFAGWEGVGLCSYLLIGFWYERHSASWAANEAFIMNRVADLGMILGMAFIYWNIGSLRYDDVFAHIGQLDLSTINIIATLLFVGAMGKSAQFPLHTWLADAMEGPTPVSALIHAATMVTAGVYLVIRAFAIYEASDLSIYIAYLGTFVALFAASMAMVNNDLKRIIAYSTLSQLGYMFAAAGMGAYWLALFHLMTHAFFKALLFLGAGNVMHAMNDSLDIKKMGGLYKALKPTAIMMTIASLALAGIYPFAGFFSKDKILEAAFGWQHFIIWFILVFTAGLTAFYSFRLVMLVFFGEKKYSKDIHPHEMPIFVLIAMSFLAILAIVSGFFEHNFYKLVASFLPMQMPHVHGGTLVALIAITIIIVLASIGFAVIKYKGKPKPRKQGFIHTMLLNNYYIPAIYNKVFVDGYTLVSKVLWNAIDKKVIDFSVDLVGKIIIVSARLSKSHHNGNLSSMLRMIGFGVFLALVIGVILLKLSQG